MGAVKRDEWVTSARRHIPCCLRCYRSPGPNQQPCTPRHEDSAHYSEEASAKRQPTCNGKLDRALLIGLHTVLLEFSFTAQPATKSCCCFVLRATPQFSKVLRARAVNRLRPGPGPALPLGAQCAYILAMPRQAHPTCRLADGKGAKALCCFGRR